MKVNIIIDGTWVGFRDGCDAIIGDVPCRKQSVGPIFHAGTQRDICQSCVDSAIPGKSTVRFISSSFDKMDEKYTTANAVKSEKPTPEPEKEEEKPAPCCTKCGEHSFSRVITTHETQPYTFESKHCKYTCISESETTVDTVLRCQCCGTDHHVSLLDGWFI